MDNRSSRRLYGVLGALILFLIIAFSPQAAAYAAEPAGDETIVCDTPTEYTEALEAPDPEGSSRFSLKRLMVFVPEGAITDNHGAVSSIYYTRGEYYILEYDSPSATKSAFKAFTAEFGDGKVFADQILTLDDADDPKPPQKVTNATPDIDSVSYGSDLMHLDEAREKYQTDMHPEDPVIVAVIDSGIRATHEMFQYEEWDNTQGKYVTKSRLIINDDANFADSASGPVTNDTMGHGTHVAGIIADGTSNQVKILPIKHFPLADYKHPELGTITSLYPCLLYAKDHGADIINMSLGFRAHYPDVEALLDPVFREFWEKDGIMCIVSAGNDEDRREQYPATSHYTYAVSALTYDTGVLHLDWGYTNYGTEVTFAAPGTDILSASNQADNEYVYMSGTSMSAPHIAAAAAMVKFCNRDYTPKEIYYMLQEVIWDSVDREPAGMYYYEQDPDGGYYGMPVFDSNALTLIPEVFSIRNFTFKLKQNTFTYSPNWEDCCARVEDIGTYRMPAPWHSDGYYDYTCEKDSDFWELSFANCDRVGTAILGLRGIYPRLIGDKYIPYTIIPVGTTLKTVKGKKKALTASWKKQAMKMPTERVNGYQIQTATNKKFTKNKKFTTVKGYKKTSGTVKKLKAKKKYFVRVRTYMTVSGKNYYSKWSKVKTVRTN